VRDVIVELPEWQQSELVQKLELLEDFPYLYPVNQKGRFRRHRRFVAGEWVIYYRVVENAIYIRGLWPVRMPQP